MCLYLEEIKYCILNIVLLFLLRFVPLNYHLTGVTKRLYGVRLFHSVKTLNNNMSHIASHKSLYLLHDYHCCFLVPRISYWCKFLLGMRNGNKIPTGYALLFNTVEPYFGYSFTSIKQVPSKLPFCISLLLCA